MGGGKISFRELKNDISKWSDGFWDYMLDNKKVLLIYDDYYEIPSQDEVSDFLKSAKESISKLHTDSWECDQYSRYLWVEAGKYSYDLGNDYKWSLGIVSGYFYWMGKEPHTCNCVYMAGDEFALIEPQTCEFKDIQGCAIRSLLV